MPLEKMFHGPPQHLEIGSLNFVGLSAPTTGRRRFTQQRPVLLSQLASAINLFQHNGKFSRSCTGMNNNSSIERQRVLNGYAGLGGNRKLWGGVQVTAVESDPKIAEVYQRLFPGDEIVIGDAHQYLLDHYSEFEFIWLSPPCQSHSKMNKATRHKSRRYPDPRLYEEIIFLQHFVAKPWVVENVAPYYQPLVPPSRRVGRHLFWSNFKIEAEEVPAPSNFINLCNLAGKKALMEWLGLYYEESIYHNGSHCPAQILRNCVHPLIGQQVLASARRWR